MGEEKMEQEFIEVIEQLYIPTEAKMAIAKPFQEYMTKVYESLKNRYGLEMTQKAKNDIMMILPKRLNQHFKIRIKSGYYFYKAFFLTVQKYVGEYLSYQIGLGNLTTDSVSITKTFIREEDYENIKKGYLVVDMLSFIGYSTSDMFCSRKIATLWKLSNISLFDFLDGILMVEKEELRNLEPIVDDCSENKPQQYCK